MNARILITLLFVFTVFSLEGQGERFKAGIIVGFNASQIDGDNVGGYSQPGIRAGIRASTILKKKWRVDTDILFSQRGSRTSETDLNYGEPFFSFRMDYVELPVSLRFSDWYVKSEDYHKVFVKAGLTYGRLFRTKHSELSGFELLDEDLRDNDLAVNFGLGFYPRKHLLAELTYTRSFYPFYLRNTGVYARNLLGYFVSLQIMYEI